MDRRKFLGVAGTSVAVAAAAAYLASDRRNITRTDLKDEGSPDITFQPGEKEILYLASLAPSGHNTQPWMVKYLEPYHWIIGNDKTKWLPAADPEQRETILSIGAFLQNLEYAANSYGFACEFKLLALSNQDEDVMEVKLTKTTNLPSFDTDSIKYRRTVRSGFLTETIKKEHIDFLIRDAGDYFQFFPNHSRESVWLNEQTIAANRQQAYRNSAQSELSNWMRFSGNEARKYGDGLTTASMEIGGITAWVIRNFYTKSDVMSTKFREQGIDKVRQQVACSGGWLLLSSQDHSVISLIETGKLLQRMLLKTREKSIAIHPMTQIIEETPFKNALCDFVGLPDTVQFILRVGYIKNYPKPVSLRRPPGKFVIHG